MDKQRWSRKEVINGKPPISLWPKVLDTQIDECFRESFQNQCKAVEMYLDQYSLKDIEKATGVKCKSVQLLTQKCLDIANDGNVYGYRCWRAFKIDQVCALNFDQANLGCRLLHRCG